MEGEGGLDWEGVGCGDGEGMGLEGCECGGRERGVGFEWTARVQDLRVVRRARCL